MIIPSLANGSMLHDVRHIFSRRAHFDSYFPAVGIGETGLPRRRFESGTGVIATLSIRRRFAHTMAPLAGVETRNDSQQGVFRSCGNPVNEW
jgi:hypothetical protein